MYWWRCRNLMREFQYRGSMVYSSPWVTLAGEHGITLSHVTPERAAVWLDLFLYPCTGSPRD
jgi:hypothetical protein